MTKNKLSSILKILINGNSINLDIINRVKQVIVTKKKKEIMRKWDVEKVDREIITFREVPVLVLDHIFL